MADVYFVVTLSSADAGSGPSYDVFYSTDCVSYSAASPATVFLPSVGSQATITIPDNSQCVKLTNINSNCNNSVSSSVVVATTTTTTSTTTTTTVAPTTTTTTGTPPPTTTTTTEACATLDWLFIESGGASGNMQLYINGVIVENRFSPASGLYTVCPGDTISVDVYCSPCSEPNNYANAYTISDRFVLTDANCSNTGATSISTGVYTVTAGDVGTTINLSAYATCDSGCV